MNAIRVDERPVFYVSVAISDRNVEDEPTNEFKDGARCDASDQSGERLEICRVVLCKMRRTHVEDLRKVLRQIAQLKDPTARNILAVSPSIPAARRKDWAYAGYKGGSEPGVLNLTWLLQKPDGAWWVLAMSWNDPAKLVDSAPLEILAQRILALP